MSRGVRFAADGDAARSPSVGKSLPVRKNWLMLSHAFNMDARAASHTITDKIPHFLGTGITPIVISAPTHHQ
jgi:hypothetical protein